MRALALLVLAGCFDPEPKPNQACLEWCPPPERCIANTCQIDRGALQPNYAFVTPTSLGLASVAELDRACATLAANHALPGTFIAWMSTPAENMRQRFAANPARGWIRADGRPFADRLEDIFAGKTYYPLRIAADGSDVGEATVATGTRLDGTFGETCSGLAPPVGLITHGKADAGLETWTAGGAVDCRDSAHLYCFGTDRANAVPVSPPAAAKRVFVTKNTYSQRPVPDADQICNSEAGRGGFGALLATPSRSVAERFATATGPWMRADGIVVTEAMASLLAPIEIAFDGTRVRGTVWFGAASLTARASAGESCDGWTTPTSNASVGQSERSAGAAPFAIAGSGCDSAAEHHFYCAEL